MKLAGDLPRASWLDCGGVSENKPPRRLVGRKLAGRLRSCDIVRNRASSVCNGWSSGHRTSQDVAALERRGLCGACALVLAARTLVPDVLVAADGRTFAVRGKLAFHRTGSDTFATREWLASDADGRDAKASRAIRSGVSGSSPMASYVFAPDAFEEDCRRTAIVVATRDAPPDCEAIVIGRKQWREQGALAL